MYALFLEMKEFRQGPQAVVIGKKIYVIGGRDCKGERILDSMECFDVKEGEWERVTTVPLLKRRLSLCFL